jgi:hypothetical protein
MFPGECKFVLAESCLFKMGAVVLKSERLFGLFSSFVEGS